MSKDLLNKKDILELGDMDDFSIEIIEQKPRKIETKTVSIYMEPTLYKDIVNRPFIFILLPFFSLKRERNVNLIYEIENAGIKFSSSLSTDTLEKFNNRQPGEFEKNVFDFIMWKFQGRLDKQIKTKDRFPEITFMVDDLIEYLGLSFHSSYYKKIEEALYNLQETTYRLKIRNQKRAGNIIREVYEKPLNLIRYKKIKEKNVNGGKERTRYFVELDYRILQELEIKHYSIFDKNLLNELRKKNKISERMFQFISMKRFDQSTGNFRLETLASIIPMNLFSIVKRKNKNGDMVEYKISKKKQVLKKLSKAFDTLVELGYLDSYNVIDILEEKSYRIYYEFNIEKNNELHKSSYLIEHEVIMDSGEDLGQLNLFDNDKECEDTISAEKVIGNQEKLFKETEEVKCIEESDEEIGIFKKLFMSFNQEKRLEVEEVALEYYKKELNIDELRIINLRNYEKDHIKYVYIKKAIKDIIGL